VTFEFIVELGEQSVDTTVRLQYCSELRLEDTVEGIRFVFLLLCLCNWLTGWRMDGLTDGLMDGRTNWWTDNGWTSWLMDWRIDGRLTYRLTNGWTDRLMDWRTDGRLTDWLTDGWTDWLMDGLIDGRIDWRTDGRIGGRNWRNHLLNLEWSTSWKLIVAQPDKKFGSFFPARRFLPCAQEPASPVLTLS
jgi:hypothetical protein